MESEIEQEKIRNTYRREEDESSGINGIKCSSTVKYLGVRVAVDKKEQIKLSKEQINKNTNLLKWRLKSVDCDVL